MKEMTIYWANSKEIRSSEVQKWPNIYHIKLGSQLHKQNKWPPIFPRNKARVDTKISLSKCFFLSYCNVKPRVQSQCVSFSILHQEYVIAENISAATIKYFVRYLKYCIVLKISIRNFHFVYACNEKHERTTCNKHPFVCQAVFTTLDCMKIKAAVSIKNK